MIGQAVLAGARIPHIAATPVVKTFRSYFDCDPNGSSSFPPPSVINSQIAEATFLAQFTLTGTENFESYPDLTPLPLVIAFGGGLTATITSDVASNTRTNAPGGANSGRYSVLPPATVSYLSAVGSDTGLGFLVTFNQPINAFGFYATDVGDFAGTLQIELLELDDTVLFTRSLDVAGPPRFLDPSEMDGDCLYCGVVGDNAASTFRKARITSTTAATEGFGFDLFSVGLVP